MIFAVGVGGIWSGGPGSLEMVDEKCCLSFLIFAQ